MNKLHLLNDIIERIPGNVLDAWMSKHGIEPEWTREHNKLLLHRISKSDKPHEVRFFNELIDWYKKEVLFYGDRILSLYKMRNGFFDLMVNSLDQSFFKKKDIFELGSIQCESNFSESPYVYITDKSVDFVYRNTTSSKIRMDGKISELTPEARDQYGDDASLVVYKTINRCFYNSISIRNDGWLELRIDNACLLDGKKGTLKSRFEDFLPIKTAFEKDISAVLQYSFALPAPENLFLAVEKIYHAKTEGRIRHL